MFQSLSLTNELDTKINKCKEIESSIIASYGKNHGVHNAIIENCINFPCWRKHGEDNIYIIGLSNDIYDNYWLCCSEKLHCTIRKLKIEKCLRSFPSYHFQFISCVYNVFSEYPEVGSPIKLWTNEEKKLLHDDTIYFFNTITTDAPEQQDHLLYLAV